MDRHHMPVALVLTRQDVPIIDRSKYAVGGRACAAAATSSRTPTEAIRR